MPSSVIRSMYYKNETQRLRVIFTSGAVYDYINVPEEEYTAIKTSGSKGIYFNGHIKGKYRFEKVS